MTLNVFWQQHLEWLACPACHGPLQPSESSLVCSKCRANWPVRNGFPEFLEAPSAAATFYDTEYWGQRTRVGVNRLDRYYFRVISDWLDELQVDASSTYLDVSSGEGHALTLARGRGARVAGVEFSRTALDSARTKFQESAGLLADSARLPFRDGLFDRISCLGSLEHYPDPVAALKELRRVAKPAARFLIVVPNKKHVFSWLLKYVDPQHLETVLSLSEWTTFLEAEGFRVLRYGRDDHTYHRPIYPFSLSSLVKGTARKCLAPIVDACDMQRAWQFYFLCETAAPQG